MWAAPDPPHGSWLSASASNCATFTTTATYARILKRWGLQPTNNYDQARRTCLVEKKRPALTQRQKCVRDLTINSDQHAGSKEKEEHAARLSVLAVLWQSVCIDRARTPPPVKSSCESPAASFKPPTHKHAIRLILWLIMHHLCKLSDAIAIYVTAARIIENLFFCFSPRLMNNIIYVRFLLAQETTLLCHIEIAVASPEISVQIWTSWWSHWSAGVNGFRNRIPV